MNIINEGLKSIRYKCNRCHCVFEITAAELSNNPMLQLKCPNCKSTFLQQVNSSNNVLQTTPPSITIVPLNE